MKSYRKNALSTLVTAALTSISLSPVHAFDLEDYETTARATNAAYTKAYQEKKGAKAYYRLMQGVVSLYGMAELFGGSNPRWLSDLGMDVPESAAFCRTHRFTWGGTSPAFPEVQTGGATFVVGNRAPGRFDYLSGKHQSAGADAYLHFRTNQSGLGTNLEVVAQMVATFPFSTEGQRQQAEADLATLTARVNAGANVHDPDPANDTSGYYDRDDVRDFYRRQFTADGDNGGPGDFYTMLNADRSGSLTLGEYCFDDDALCPAGHSCIDTSINNSGYQGMLSDWWWGSAYANTTSLRFRCLYDGQQAVWPPNRVDQMTLANAPTLLGVSDTDDGPGLQTSNGFPYVGDILTTLRATRDAYMKAANELKLADAPNRSAQAATIAAQQVYLESMLDSFE